MLVMYNALLTWFVSSLKPLLADIHVVQTRASNSHIYRLHARSPKTQYELCAKDEHPYYYTRGRKLSIQF